MQIATSPEPLQLILEVNRLLNIVLAGEAKAKLLRLTYYDVSIQDAAAAESEEIYRLLLVIASSVRVLDDRFGRSIDSMTGSCGKLIADLRKPTKIAEISVREACNKIIHAHRLQVTIEQEDSVTAWFGRTVTLDGETAFRTPVLWSATLDLPEFCRNILEVVVHYWIATRE